MNDTATNNPQTLKVTLVDWQSEDGSKPENPIAATLEVQETRIDLKLADERSIWVEWEDGKLRVHGYLPETTGHLEPVNMDIAKDRITVSTDGEAMTVDTIQPHTNSHTSPNTAPVRSFLDLSTAHITEQTSRWLATRPEVFKSETGFLIWVQSTEHLDPEYPGELKHILKHALGAADYIMLDQDAPTDPRFPTYDW